MKFSSSIIALQFCYLTSVVSADTANIAMRGNRELQQQTIIGFELVDGENDVVLGPITENDVIFLDADVDVKSLNVVAVTNVNTTPVGFSIAGSSFSKTERLAPYALWYVSFDIFLNYSDLR